MVQGIGKVTIGETHQIAITVFHSHPYGKALPLVRRVRYQGDPVVIGSLDSPAQQLGGGIEGTVINENKLKLWVIDGEIIDLAKDRFYDFGLVVDRQNNRNGGQAEPLPATLRNGYSS